MTNATMFHPFTLNSFITYFLPGGVKPLFTLLCYGAAFVTFVGNIYGHIGFTSVDMKYLHYIVARDFVEFELCFLHNITKIATKICKIFKNQNTKFF